VSSLGNKNSDAGHIECSRSLQVPHLVYTNNPSASEAACCQFFKSNVAYMSRSFIHLCSTTCLKHCCLFYI